MQTYKQKPFENIFRKTFGKQRNVRNPKLDNCCAFKHFSELLFCLYDIFRKNVEILAYDFSHKLSRKASKTKKAYIYIFLLLFTTRENKIGFFISTLFKFCTDSTYSKRFGSS
jgi:hypothetical protein